MIQMKPCLVRTTLCFILVCLSGCACFRRGDEANLPVEPIPVASESVEGETLDPALLRPPEEPFTLGPGDVVEIEVVGDPETRTLVPVGPDGRIYFHVVPGVDVWGLTPSEARVRLEEGLGQYYRNPPRVNVTLREVGSQQVWLLGRFVEPGIYPLTGPTTLLEAITLAGGPQPTPVFATLSEGGAATFADGSDEAADLERAFVIRDGDLLPINFHELIREGDMSQNIYLRPDDLVYLPSAVSSEVHVLGAVERPRAVAHTRRTTLLAAIAMAGGAKREAHLQQVAVVRGTSSNPEVIIVNLYDVMRGERPDVQLQSRDIVYVPLQPYRLVRRYVKLILTTFARTVGVNAGAHAMDRDEGAGISVPLGR